MSSPPPNLDALRIDRTLSEARRSGAWWLVPVVLLLAAAGAWWFFRGKADPSKAPVTPAGAVPITTEARGKDDPPASRTLLNASGYVTTRLDATVSSKITGKIAEILVEEGMKVEKGQVLAKLDASNAESALRIAEARLVAARATLTEAEPAAAHASAEYDRLSGLLTSKSVSQSDLGKAGSEAKTQLARLARLKSEIVVAEQEVEDGRQQLDDTIIRAPFAGVVTTKDSQPGEMISPMSAGGFTRTGICTLVDMTSLEIEVDVGESFINRVNPGQPVEATLDAYPDYKIPCKVIAIIPTADRQKATVKVRVAFEKTDPRILPQMGVKVAFQQQEPPP